MPITSTLSRSVILGLLGVALLLPGARAADSAESPRQRILFDRDWRFHQGDVPPGPGGTPDAAGFDDLTWRPVNLPHDWMIEGVKGTNPQNMDGPFDKGSPAGGGGAFLNGGIGWYRKTFTLPAEAQGKEITLLFDGAYMNADVWLNGQHLGTHPYGFTSFYYDITSALKHGGEKNALAVKLDVKQPSCRWYSGAGLYRDVWLIETAPAHVGMWGTYVTTPHIAADHAQVHVQTTVRNDGAAPQTVSLKITIVDPRGKTVAETAMEQPAIQAKGEARFDRDLVVPKPQLWSVENPTLYKEVTELTAGGHVLDHTETSFGIRSFQFTVDKGFFLNGKHVIIQGVCDHHDLGALGSAAYTRGIQRQLEILKSMGCNAIRTSHNPPAPALLDLCDRMGFVVMDEAFDEWKINKTTHGYGEFFDQWSEPDVVSMLDRDRNHPSIILWSIGNEIPEGFRDNAQAGPMAQRLAGFCHREDPSRPVTSACPGPPADWKDGLAKALDVFGINYSTYFYPANSPKSRAHPPSDPSRYGGTLPMVGSETQSQIDTRGEYGLSVNVDGEVHVDMRPDHQVSCYDGYWPKWANNPDDEFIALNKAPWVAGEFVWTGFDYLGEPYPYPWPARSSYFGIIDLCGFPKDRYYAFKARWGGKPLVHMLPHWTWPGFEGKPIPVKVYTNAQSVELFLNGKSLGSKRFPEDCERAISDPTTGATKPTAHLGWSVPYEPGELKAVATNNGNIVASDIERTAGQPVKIDAVADRGKILSGDHDLSFIKISILDKQGNICPNASPELQFSLTGNAATIAGLDNGDPTNHEFFQGTRHKAFHGLALAILKSHEDATGTVTLTISAPGLEPATVDVDVAPAGKAAVF
jgi:beta-galactosidase